MEKRRRKSPNHFLIHDSMEMSLDAMMGEFCSINMLAQMGFRTLVNYYRYYTNSERALNQGITITAFNLVGLHSRV